MLADQPPRCVGQEFDLDVLLAAVSHSEVLQALDAALSARVLEERRGSHVGRYGFAHALIQETLYEELSAHHR